MSLAGYERVPRYAELVNRLLGEEVEFLPPGLILELDRPEWKFLKRESLFSSGPVIVAANVANPSQNSARYPATVLTPTMAVITGIKVCGVNVVAADRYQLTIDGAIAGAFGRGFDTDLRGVQPSGTTSGTSVQFAGDNSLGGVSGDIIDEKSANATGQDLYFDALPLVLVNRTVAGQNVRYSVWSVAVNKALRTVWWGYERALRPEEVPE